LPAGDDRRAEELTIEAAAPVRKRVALLGPAPPDRGGIAHETARLARELSRLTTLDYYTFSRPYPTWMDPRRFAVDPALPPAGAKPLLDYRSPRSWRSAADEIARGGAAAVLVPWWTSFWAVPMRGVFRRLAARAPAVARILVCHNVEEHESGAAKRWLSFGALDLAQAYVVHSESSLAELMRRFPGRPAEVVPLPVPEAPAISKEAARRRLGLPEHDPLVLFLGLVRAYKGVDLLLDAAPRIVASSGARIAVVGEVFPDARDLARRARTSPVADRILWRDEYVPEPEMGVWLAASDVLALPYRRISASAIAARAVAATRPMAAADAGGLPETVVPGVTGELFPAGNASSLADAVLTILERGFDAYREGLERAATAARWPRYAERVLAFAERCASSF
jgi:glycosyltransferase involved in cell wall biosynthesis